MEVKSKQLFNKLASVMIFFWIIKIVSATVGEASADYLHHHFGIISFILVFIALIPLIAVQIRFKKSVPWMYWLVMILVAILGTMCADRLHHAGLPLEITTSLFIVALLIMLGVWYVSEKTLDVHKIHNTKCEILYWIAILFTFSIGTASGDLLASGLNLGLLKATLVFGVVLAIIPSILYLCNLNRIALFWIATVLTRPFGASGADLIGKPVAEGGFGLGVGSTSILFLIIIIALIGYLTVTHKKQMLHEELAD
ncbi:MAG: hypothetical protein HKM04_01725 [Legionellales bacterium]|nr:hypothetical protein [Legionellales bacterium]